VVRIESAGGKQWNVVRSGSSYASQSDLAVTFGLAKDATVTAVDVEWPSGTRDHIVNLKANQFITIEEGKGVVVQTPVAPGRSSH
jgi:enediyne biosynthesis protein E4